MPLLGSLLDASQTLSKQSERIVHEPNPIEAEGRISCHYQVLVRDLSSILILVIKLVETHKDDLQSMTDETMQLFSIIAGLFHCWYKSPHFRREYQSFLVTDDAVRLARVCKAESTVAVLFGAPKSDAVSRCSLPTHKSHTCPCGKAAADNAMANCLKKLVPLVIQGLSEKEQRLVQEGQAKMLSQVDKFCFAPYIAKRGGLLTLARV